MRVLPRALLAFVVTVSASVAFPVAGLAAEPTFGTPVGSAPLGEPLTITSDIDGVEGGTVEVLVWLAGREPQVVVVASPGTVAGSWQASAELDVPSAMECACPFEGTSPPNSRIEFRFRVRAADGTATLGPVGQTTVTDDRFEWRTIEQDLVRVHWYEGDEAFAQAAADVANTAIDEAAALLGSTLPEPVDLFVYATQDALVEAVAPNRENIAGQAHSTIGTMFVWLPPHQDPERSRVIVAHELTHLVFNETTDNPYHGPPRWLNEGVAVYLSEGYSLGWSSMVTIAARNGSLIPLQGLAGFFPSDDQFELAYGESVSAVDYFVRTYTEQTLWDLVRSYSQGLSDDDAFTAATGGDMAAFNADWMASLGAEVPEPLGPQPAPPGPVPSAWANPGQPTAEPGASVSPGVSPGASSPAATVAPGRSVVPTAPPARPGEGVSSDSTGQVLLALVVGLAVLAAVVVLVLLIQRGRTRRPPPYY